MKRVNVLVISGAYYRSQNIDKSIFDGQIEFAIKIKAPFLAVCKVFLTVNVKIACIIIFDLTQVACFEYLGDYASYGLKSQAPIFLIITTYGFFSK